MRSIVPSLCLLAVAAVVTAADTQTSTAAGDAPPSAVPPVVVGPPSAWTRKGVIGAYLNNITTANADESHDPTINGTTGSTSWSAKLDVGLEWRSGNNSVENLLKAEYGQIHQRDQEWQENKDELRYDGVYRRVLAKPSFVYVGWGGETVFTGPAPTYDAFQPFLAKAGAGFGQMYENMLPEKDRFEWRLGARAQKRWGRYVSDDQDGIQTGIEAFLRYERQAIIQRDDQDLRYFVQYEGFSQFNDLSHITNLITAGLTYQFTRFLTLDLALRAYYETRTKDDENHAVPGYNQWGIRQDTMLGLAYTF
jgi:hypothetical protein